MADTPGDDPAPVGSGPTLPDRTRLLDANRILDLYGIAAPEHVRTALADPSNETPKASADTFGLAQTSIVARSNNALLAAGLMASAAGYTPVKHSVILTFLLGVLVLAKQYLFPGMIPR